MSVVGFDIGYQSCYIAVARLGGIETIDNDYSDRNTPAFVSFMENQRVIGHAARGAAVSNIKNTVYGFKRFLGRKFIDPFVQHEISRGLPYSVVEGESGEAMIKVSYLNQETCFLSQQITAMLLTKLKLIAEDNLRTKVVDCVISVPTYFTDVERRALLEAAQIAGLNCLRLMNDSTAAALAYGIYKQDLPKPEENPRYVAIVDMGHADTQVEICAFNTGKLKVISSASEPNLGGRDFDAMLFNHFAMDFQKRYHIDATSNLRAKSRLFTECEKTRKLMSANIQEIPINIECFMEDKDVSARFDRASFEDLITPHLDKLRAVLLKALDASKLTIDQIEFVETIGGCTRTPVVKQICKEIFGKEPSTTLNAEEAVARGCALQCAILSPTFRVRDFSITDAQPYSVTVTWPAENEGGQDQLIELFPKFSPIPHSKQLSCTRSQPFSLTAAYTSADPKETGFPEQVFGQFHIKNVCPNPETGLGQKVKVKLRVNIHGIFIVSSASLVERVEKQPEVANEEKKEAKDVMETDNGVKDDKGSEEAQGDAEKPTNGPVDAQAQSAMDTSESLDGVAVEAEQVTNAASPPEGGAEPAVASGKKYKCKTIDLPVESSVARLDKVTLNELVEKELQMQQQDKLEKERADAKNAVEEYVYDMRNKLACSLQEFIKETDSDIFNAKLTETEDWLYDEGEFQNREVYSNKLSELRKLGDPVVMRYQEFEGKPEAFGSFQASMQKINMVLHMYAENDEKYNHLDVAEMKRVADCVSEKRVWFEQQLRNVQNTPKFENPPVTVAQIREQKQQLDHICHPIINKSKPKPKVEEPPPPPAASATDEASSKPGTDEQSSNNQPENAPPSQPQSKTDMDLD